eukprot:TRINITY_DN515_c0_g1_i4.p2 TRINITY_DN515_c0_g1~~TRINITY_DN515_c0_g1_i4.p2  ORF type:complete len:124 (-),score=21.81 TRINITY_DN515_c0_g1_i4:158-529(-)
MRAANINFRPLHNKRSSARTIPARDANKHSTNKVANCSVVTDLRKKLFNLVAAEGEGTLRLFTKNSRDDTEDYFFDEDALMRSEKNVEKDIDDLEEEEHPQIIYLDSETETDRTEPQSDDTEE